MNIHIVKEKDIGRVGMTRFLILLPLVFLIIGLIYGLGTDNLATILIGLKAITLSPTILLTDFLEVGGVASSLINVALVGFFNIYLIRRYELKINGVLIAAFFTVLGFSFFGKNLFNILPIYLGGYLYTKYQKISFKEVIAVIMFGTALSPLISEIGFYGFLNPMIALALAVAVGVFIGFVIVPLSSHMLKFHDGYNLYNIGFTSGIIGTVMTSFLRSVGITVTPVNIIYADNDWVIILLVITILVCLFFCGLYINGEALSEYKRILVYKGRLISDYTHLVGYGVTLVNMSLIGMVSLGYVLLVGGVVNGPVLAGVFTVMGFGAFGKHLKNIIPVMLGVIICAMILGYELNSTGVIISVLFSTTLAPIAGTYGPIIGLISGMLHMVLVTNVGVIHGGVNLYNNGFSGGIVAAVLIPVVDAFKKGR